MKVKLSLIIVLTTVVLVLFSCSSLKSSSSAARIELSVDSASSGKEVILAVGGRLTITLASNHTIHYSWNEKAKIGNTAIMQQLDHEYQLPAIPITGLGGVEVWTFKALKAGKTTISMDYRDIFEPYSTANTFKLTVLVQ